MPLGPVRLKLRIFSATLTTVTPYCEHGEVVVVVVGAAVVVVVVDVVVVDEVDVVVVGKLGSYSEQFIDVIAWVVLLNLKQNAQVSSVTLTSPSPITRLIVLGKIPATKGIPY